MDERDDLVPDHAGPPPRQAGGRLTIDLAALTANWRAMAKVCEPAETAGIVKSDAYGLGAAQVARTLVAAGCRTFFVAFPAEGIAVRAVAPDARIFVLNGLFGDGVEQDYLDHDLVPCLNSPAEIALWESFLGARNIEHACAVNVDTGMNRLGLSISEALTFADENALTRALAPALLMTHLACADDPANPKNQEQADAFARIAQAFGDIPTSLVNSAGVFLGRDWHHDLTRPGIAIYGGAPRATTRNPMRPVVTAEARVSQVRYAKAGETVYYGATQALERDTAIAVCAVGYADGYPRSASAAGVPLRATGSPGGHGFVAGRKVPILGRVTMDATMFDVTECGEAAVGRGDWIELFGPNIALDEAAAAAGTVSYELLTSLGARYHRLYVGGETVYDGRS